MDNCINKLPFLKKLNNSGSNDRGRSRGSTRDVFSMPNRQSEKNKVSFKDIANTLLRTTLLVKNLSVSYRQNQGVVLPGVLIKNLIFGQDWEAMAPGIPFVFRKSKYRYKRVKFSRRLV